MAWTAPMTFVSGAALTAAQLNTYVRDNFNETAPAKAATVGAMFVTTAAGSIAERLSAMASVLTNETTTSTSYADLATVGPASTRTLSTQALVMITAQQSCSTVNGVTYASIEITDATSLSPADNRALSNTSATANAHIMCSSAILFGGLTAGSNTFTAKYRVNTGTGTFLNRRVIVMPF